MDIPVYYDPMIAKLITYGKDRSEAIERMIRAIDDYKIVGIETTLPFCKFVMQHDAFTSGNFDTHFVGKYFTPEVLDGDNADADIAAMMSAIIVDEASNKVKFNTSENTSTVSDWRKNRL